MEKQQSSRAVLALIELALIAAIVALLWWKPVNESLAVVMAAILTLVVIALAPALVKGSVAEASAKEKEKLEDQWRQ